MNKFVLLGIMLALISVLYVSALPTGPTSDITPINPERLDTWGPKTVVAQAGNVTEFNTDGSTITRTWQGYFGNITGTIVLGDTSNNTLYDWNLANPQGEIYAVRSASLPSWTNARCANQAELIAEDTTLGVDSAIDEDAVNRTFVVNGSAEAIANYGGAALGHPTFWVATSQINTDTCAVTYMYNNSGSPSDSFREVILSDGGLVPIIYTALLAHNFNPTTETTGFDGRTHDFQMIVGEDGHGTDFAPSTYYFYLELE
jgi:hypothetical protein